jgi:preprotein translocase subunit SecA
MNEQRRIVYAYRDEVLEGKDMGETAREEIASVIRRLVEDHTPGDYTEEWDLDGLFVALDDIFPPGFGPDEIDDTADREGVIEGLTDDAEALYDRREAELGEEIMRALERYLLLNIIDQRWREHLYDMDYLREGIHLRGFAQIDPLVAYKNEAFELFSDLMATIWSDFARMVFNVPVEIEEAGGPENVVPEQPRNAPGSSTTSGRVTYSGGGEAQPSALTAAAAASGANGAPSATYEQDEVLAAPVEQRRLNPDEQIGRNDPCWCGSGKKYKKCHGS